MELGIFVPYRTGFQQPVLLFVPAHQGWRLKGKGIDDA
jgi:hypothetical protein